MDKEFGGSWGEALEILEQARDTARGINQFTDLEELAMQGGRKLTQILLQGFTDPCYIIR